MRLCQCICDYADAYILVKGTITIAGAKQLDERNNGIMFKNCALFTKCISRINDTENTKKKPCCW